MDAGTLGDYRNAIYLAEKGRKFVISSHTIKNPYRHTHSLIHHSSFMTTTLHTVDALKNTTSHSQNTLQARKAWRSRLNNWMELL